MGLTPEQQANFVAVERGSQLVHTLSTPGWNRICAIMNTEIESAKHALYEYRGADRDMLFVLQSRVFALNEAWNRLQLQINNEIQQAHEIVSQPGLGEETL